MARRPILIALPLLAGCSWYIDEADREAWRCDHWLAQGSWYLDEDLDGYGDVLAERADCPRMDLFVAVDGDCDDANASRFPGNPELCQDGIDQDCDGEDPQRVTWYPDQDVDGFGDAAGALESCDAPEGAVTEAGDCDDQDATTFPGAPDLVCGDGIDQDCDGRIECSLSGDVDLSTGWSQWGITRTLASGAPAGLGAGADVDGDGIADAAASGASSAWAITVGDDRDDESTRLSPDLGTAADPGLRLAMVSASGVGAIALGSPDLVGDGGTGIGTVALIWSGDDARVGLITAPSDYSDVGAMIASTGSVLAVGAHTEVDDGLTAYVWELTLLSGEAIPGPDETLRLDRAVSDAVIEVSRSLERKEPRLTLGEDAGGLELAAAFLPALSSGETRINWFSVPLDGELTEDDAGFSRVASGADLGSALALIDLDGDGALDLALGAPEAGGVEVHLGPADQANEAPDHTFNGTGAGAALANVGDVDGDGLDDLAIGGPTQDRVWLVLGGSTGASADLESSARIFGPAGSAFGGTLAGADLDGDGWSDLVVGAEASSALYVLWGGP